MSGNFSQVVHIRLEPAGFLLELAEDRGELTLQTLCEYIGQLHIPGVDPQAVAKAFNEPEGAPVRIAPRLAPPIAAASKSQTNSSSVIIKNTASSRRRVVRWQKPSFRGKLRISEAESVLIVDTSTAMVKTFESAFKNSRTATRLASQPNVFFETISKKVPDLIMVAAQLGKIDARVLAARIRLDSRTASTPVIMYSQPRPRKEIVQAFDSGITDYLVLPCDHGTFRKKLQHVLAQVRKTIVSDATAQEQQAEEARDDRLPAVANLNGLVRKVRDVLAVPHILDRILKISGDSEAGAAELAQAIQSDVATTAITLRKANTVFYGSGVHISNVQQAVVRVGFGEIRNLVLGMNVIKQFSTEQKSNGFDRHDFWLHSLGTAILAKSFAQQMRLPFKEEAFVGGLLHDLGKIILDEYCNPPFDKVVMEAINQMEPILWAEKRLLSFSHVDVGSAVLQEWRFPEELRTVVRRHHSPEGQAKETAKEKDLILARLVFVGNLLAKALGVGSGGDLSIGELPSSSWVHALNRLNFDDEGRAQFQKELAEISDFLEISPPLGGAVAQASEDLPCVFYIDPMHSTRPFTIIGIHLRAMGYEVQEVLAPEDLATPANDKPYAICLRVDRYDRVQQAMDRLAAVLGEQQPRLVVILPESERKKTLDRRQSSSPPGLVDQHSLLFEPFPVEQLHNALEQSS